MRVRIVQRPMSPDKYIVQYKQWWQFLWRTYSNISFTEAEALAIARRLANPLIVEISP